MCFWQKKFMLEIYDIDMIVALWHFKMQYFIAGILNPNSFEKLQIVFTILRIPILLAF